MSPSPSTSPEPQHEQHRAITCPTTCNRGVFNRCVMTCRRQHGADTRNTTLHGFTFQKRRIKRVPTCSSRHHRTAGTKIVPWNRTCHVTWNSCTKFAQSLNSKSQTEKKENLFLKSEQATKKRDTLQLLRGVEPLAVLNRQNAQTGIETQDSKKSRFETSSSKVSRNPDLTSFLSRRVLEPHLPSSHVFSLFSLAFYIFLTYESTNRLIHQIVKDSCLLPDSLPLEHLTSRF